MGTLWMLCVVFVLILNYDLVENPNIGLFKYFIYMGLLVVLAPVVVISYVIDLITMLLFYNDGG